MPINPVELENEMLKEQVFEEEPNFDHLIENDKTSPTVKEDHGVTNPFELYCYYRDIRDQDIDHKIKKDLNRT